MDCLQVFNYFITTALFMTGPVKGPISWLGFFNFNVQVKPTDQLYVDSDFVDVCNRIQPETLAW